MLGTGLKCVGDWPEIKAGAKAKAYAGQGTMTETIRAGHGGQGTVAKHTQD